MKKYLSILLLAFALIGCNGNDSYSEANYNANDIIGEWLLVEGQNKTYAMDIIFNTNSMMEMYVFKNPSDENFLVRFGSGVWTYSREAHNLETRGLYNGEKQEVTRFYNVSHADSYTLLMYDKLLKSSDTYIRVAKTYNLFMLDKQNIADLPAGFHAQKYETLNEDVAAVDENGVITGTGIGTTFILARDGDKTVAVKVNIESGVNLHAKEVNSNIETIIEKHGNYDYKSDLSNGLYVISYINPADEPCASVVFYHYEPYSGSIVCVEVVYDSNKALKSDQTYLGSHYNYLNLPKATLYVDMNITDFFDSSYFIMEMTNGLRYASTGYLKTYRYLNAWGNTIPGLFGD